MKYIILDGKLLKREDANISVFNKAMFFNFAVYDSMKVVRGKAFFPEFHVDRLINSAKIIKLEHPFKREDILKWIDLLVQKNKLDDAMIRFLLLGPGDPKQKPRIFCFLLDLHFIKIEITEKV